MKTFSSGKTELEAIYHDPNDSLNHSEITYFENGKIKNAVDFTDNKFNGKIIEYYENGLKKFEGTTRNGAFIGIKKSYDEKGNISQLDSLFGECEANNCCCDGVVSRFFPNGKLKEKFTYKLGMINGNYVKYFENGRIAEECIFINDKIDGSSKYWLSNGELSKIKTFRLGVADGPTIEYHDSFMVKGNYANGKEYGIWKYTNDSGKVIQVDIYKNGKLLN